MELWINGHVYSAYSFEELVEKIRWCTCTSMTDVRIKFRSEYWDAEDDILERLSDILKTYTNLKSISFDIDTTDIPSFLIESVNKDIETIELNFKNLTQLQPHIFKDFQKLRSVSISNTNVTSIPPHLFDNCPELSVATFCSNKITSIPPTLFSNNKNLSIVVFDSNKLTSIPSSLFSNNKNLTKVEFGFNRITSIPQSLFAGCTELVVVSFNSNPISQLPNGFLDGCQKLQYVHLFNTRVKEGFIIPSKRHLLEKEQLSPQEQQAMVDAILENNVKTITYNSHTYHLCEQIFVGRNVVTRSNDPYDGYYAYVKLLDKYTNRVRALVDDNITNNKIDPCITEQIYKMTINNRRVRSITNCLFHRVDLMKVSLCDPYIFSDEPGHITIFVMMDERSTSELDGELDKQSYYKSPYSGYENFSSVMDCYKLCYLISS
jgi:hypothetical protein